MLDLSDMH